MQPLLERAPLHRSRDSEATQAFYSAKGTRFELIRPARGVPAPQALVNGVFLPNLWFGYVDFGDAAVALHLSPHASSFRAVDRLSPGGAGRSATGDYYLHIPLRGRIQAEIPGSILDCDQRRGVLITPGTEQVVRAQPGTARLSLSIRGDALNRQLALLLGHEPARPLIFDPAVQLEERYGRSLAGMLRWTALDFDRDGTLFANALIAGQFEQFVLNWLLLAQPSNYSEAICARSRPIAPRDVRRAVDFIHENLARQVTLADLVRISGVAGRTLLKHFSDIHGTPPMRYARNLRMQRVRAMLENGQAREVTEAALRWGFAHAGRFSIAYRRRFGESPSVTLARGRAHSGA